MTGAGRGLAFGIDIGGTKMLGVAIDADDEIVAEARVPTPHAALDLLEQPASALEQGGEPGTRGAGAPGTRGAGTDVADAVVEVVRLLRLEIEGGTGRANPATPGPAPATPGTVPATGPSTRHRSATRAPVGVGAPGMLDRDGVLRFSPNLPGAAGADLHALISVRMPGTTVVVENDANCAALAELRHGALRGAEDAVVVTLGTGIGGGIVRGDRVVLGAFGFAGEIGHMVVDPAGPPCPCGRRGCWERYASGGGLARLAREAAYAGRLGDVVAMAGGDPELVRGEHVTRAARRGEPGALGVMDELGWWIALGLTNLVAILDPERIVLGGGLGEAEEMLLAPTRRAFAHLAEGAVVRPDIEILVAELGERAGAVGAAMMARTGGLG
ncbi:MAG: ROK family protein [Actinomycetota bacterium]|nr:ROK family protein [Actinomycetota bacterium]